MSNNQSKIFYLVPRHYSKEMEIRKMSVFVFIKSVRKWAEIEGITLSDLFKNERKKINPKYFNRYSQDMKIKTRE